MPRIVAINWSACKEEEEEEDDGSMAGSFLFFRPQSFPGREAASEKGFVIRWTLLSSDAKAVGSAIENVSLFCIIDQSS